ncbi:RE1-silencing transcription factor B-like [Cylas formicarius]|uniref:RE1-silencing transcription factor B-like n=1 Tax=Cylas formicarius TaxID=197179 RepID=UPI002958379B|nr:RE1-silencing transcription factor B-like [Cylas formicarius]
MNEPNIICRTCLKVVETNKFTYIDDETGYVQNVGNIREMLQFCIPELDLYVSSKPVICYVCLPILVTVYNFKIKCLSGENIIKGYITRNNLVDYNYVNLNCVLMDEVRVKNQDTQIENKIKEYMENDIKESEAKDLEIDKESELKAKEEVTVENDDLMDINEEKVKTEKIEGSDVGDAENIETVEPTSNLILKVNKSQLKEMDTPCNKESVENAEIRRIMREIGIIPSDDSLQSEESLSSGTSFNPMVSNILQNGGALMSNTECTDSARKDYTCKHCPFSTTKVELFGKHMSTVHPKPMLRVPKGFTVIENYACYLCPFSASTMELLRKHHTISHAETEDTLILNDHLPRTNRSEGNEVTYKRSNEYSCTVCTYVTRDKSNFRKHSFTHGTKPLKCSQCSYECVSPYQLRRHVKQKHEGGKEKRTRNKPYVLPVVGPVKSSRDGNKDDKITFGKVKELEEYEDV